MNRTDRSVLEIYGAYDYVLPAANNEHFLVQHHGRWGAIAPTGATLIPVEQDWVEYLATVGVFVLEQGGVYAAVDAHGTVVVPYGYSRIEHLANALYEVSDGDGHGVYDADTQLLVLPCMYSKIEYLDTDRVRVWRESGTSQAQCGAFSAAQKAFIVPLAFRHLHPLTPTLFLVSCAENHCGVFSTIHQTCIVPPRYVGVRRLTDTLYLVGKGGNVRPVFFLSEEQREYS